MTKKNLEELEDMKLLELYKLLDSFIKYLETELGEE